MTLTRVPMPSPCYSSRGGAAVNLLVVHTAEGATTIESLGNFFANPANEVSSHAGADDKPGTIGVYVKRLDKAWTAAAFNPQACQIEACGFAAWSRDDWLVGHPKMVENIGLWLGEEAAAFGIPLRRLSAAEAQSGVAGVCGHIDLGSAGGGHVDPDYGSGAFPWSEVLAIAGGVPVAVEPAPPATGGAAPPWPGVVLANFTAGHGTATWQGQLRARGWSIDVDDLYGDQSEQVCRDFQAEALAEGHDIGAPAPDGLVGPKTWQLAWSKPVT